MVDKVKFLIGISFTLLFCTLQTTAQVPESPVKAPPPPPPIPPVEEIFLVIEEMPNFLGCGDTLGVSEKKQCIEEKMNDYIYSNLEYPKLARENGVEGTVVVRFFVDKDGTIKEPELLKDIGAGCGQEAIRLITAMDNVVKKKWTPGSARKKAVKVCFNLPIKFDLDN